MLFMYLQIALLYHFLFLVSLSYLALFWFSSTASNNTFFLSIHPTFMLSFSCLLFWNNLPNLLSLVSVLEILFLYSLHYFLMLFLVFYLWIFLLTLYVFLFQFFLWLIVSLYLLLWVFLVLFCSRLPLIFLPILLLCDYISLTEIIILFNINHLKKELL